jgi:hypothetical protein
VLRHAKEAESHGFSSRPTLASEAMPRWSMANVGETYFPTKYLINRKINVLSEWLSFLHDFAGMFDILRGMNNSWIESMEGL